MEPYSLAAPARKRGQMGEHVRDAPITIIMATFNGGGFFAEQVDSILSQTSGEWVLRIFDDGSCDGTLERARGYAEAHPGLVAVTANVAPTGSAKANFLLALQAAEPTPYLMFSDQDDVWNADKVERTMAAMRALEERWGVDAPLLVYTDQTVVDGQLRELAPSMMRYSALDGNANGIAPMLVQNVVTGCTMLANRALWELAAAHPAPPDEVVLHDWWLGQLAASCGHLAYLDEPTMLYRQHGSNVIGASDAGSAEYLAGRAREGGFAESFAMMERQAAFLLEQVGEQMDPVARTVVADFADLPNRGKFGRLGVCMRHGIWKTGWHRRLAQVLFI